MTNNHREEAMAFFHDEHRGKNRGNALFITMTFIFVLVTLLYEILSFSRIGYATGKEAAATTRELKVFDMSTPSGLATEFDNNHYNLASHSAWASLVPLNRGILTRSEKQGGPKSQLALYQQLDCINQIRISFLFLYNVTTPEGTIYPDFTATERCFGILRQLLLCAADTTMEIPGPPQLQADGTIAMGIIRGLGVAHRCMNWEMIMNYVDRLSG